MKKAIERLRAVLETQQESVARFVLNELEDDDRWTASTLHHAEALSRLAERVLESDARGSHAEYDKMLAAL